MKLGNPQSIFFIAVGVLLLNLGWSGRFKAVYEALRTGTTADGSPPATDGTPGGTPEGGTPGDTDPTIPGPDLAGECRPADLRVKWNGNVTLCLDPNKAYPPKPASQLDCPNGQKLGVRADTNQQICFAEADVRGREMPASGGQAEMFVGMSLAQQMTPRWNPRSETGISDGIRPSFFP